MKITRFEDLDCWKEARILVNMVYEAVRNSESFQKDLRFVGQITSLVYDYNGLNDFYDLNDPNGLNGPNDPNDLNDPGKSQ